MINPDSANINVLIICKLENNYNLTQFYNKKWFYFQVY